MAGSSGQHYVVNAMKEIMQRGGSAIDGVIAGMTCTWAISPILGGPTGSALFLVASPEGEYVVDAIATHPHTGRDRQCPEIQTIYMDSAPYQFEFGESVTAPTCLLRALLFLHRKHGVLPWKTLFEPVLRYLDEGFLMSEYNHKVLVIFQDVIQKYGGLKYLFGDSEGHLKAVGDRVFNEKLKGFFIELGDSQDHTILRASYEALGLQFEDIDFLIKEPLRASVFDCEVLTNPPPAPGGLLVLHCLSQLSTTLSPNEPELERVYKIMAALKETMKIRKEKVDGRWEDPDLAVNVLGNTEHYNITDKQGLTISVTASNGTGSAIVCEKYGFLYNNLLGEPDLNPNGFLQAPPGSKIPSMMSPVLIKKNGKVKYSLGSSGSERIRAAIVNTIVNLELDGLSLSESIEKRRIHYDGTRFDIEEPAPPALFTSPDIVSHPALSILFGGCHGLDIEHNTGKGDPRRDGSEFSF